MGQEQAPSSVMFAPKFKAKAPIGAAFERSASASELHQFTEQRHQDTFPPAYKPNEIRRPQFKANGYQSEPEPNYESDYTTVKYRTLDRRRQQFLPSTAHVRNVATNRQEDNLYGTMPNPIKSEQISYKNQPGRIEDYTTGHSSVSEKEKKEWWDEVMDIFNGWLRDNTKKPCIIIEFVDDVNEMNHLDQTKLASQHYTEGNLSRALTKESGYTSDSNIVFRKKEVPQGSPLSPVEQKQAYKSLQAGGEPPLFGFRKPAPEKPKGFVEEFEYFQITPTLTKIRVTCKDINGNDAETKFEKPTTENKMSRTKKLETHFDVFTPFPKNMPSFIPLSQKKEPSPPPLPPNRRSSYTKASMKVEPEKAVVTKAASTKTSHRHEQCFQSPNDTVLGASKYGTITLRKTGRREPICRSKSTGAVSTLLASLISMKDTKTTDRENVRTTVRQQHIRLGSVSPTRRQPRVVSLRQSSRSPVAFGRSISKERTFAEEKKRLENTLPLSRATFKASTNILRDPSLKSPQDVKHAMRSYATCSSQIPPPPRSKSLPRIKPSSTTVNTTMRHTMCFPRVQQTKVVEYYRPTTAPVQKTTANSKSYTPVKSDQKLSSKTGTKSVSTVSLPRSNSTFSVESTSRVTISKDKILNSTAKMAAKIKSCTKKNKEPKSITAALQNSKSDGYIGRKASRLLDSFGSKKEHKASTTSASKKPESVQEMHASHYFREIVPSLANDNKYYFESSIRDKAMLWNDFNAHKSKSLTHPVPNPPLPPPVRNYVTSYHKSRSLSPNRHQQLSEKCIEDLYTKCDDFESEFGETSCIEDLVWQYEQQGRKESCPKSPNPNPIINTNSRPESPYSSYSSYSNNRKFSPTREVRVPQTPRNVRSPSRRKIESCRTNSSKSDATNKVVRASSLSSADDRSKHGLYLCSDLAHSATSLTYLERHSPTCRYRNNSERFADLNRFYNTLERVGQLERATSVTNFKPIRKDTELLDFDEWRKIRIHERAEKELNYLVKKLKQDEKEKDLVFRPKDIDDVKWRKEFDFGLHSREKSVEDLRENFERNRLLKAYENTNLHKEYYRPYWRRNTVADLASSLEVQINPEISSTAFTQKTEIPIEPNDIHLSNRLVSTLSKEQVLKISQQLNDIYSNNTKADTGAVSEEYIVTVDNKSKPTPSTNALKVRCNSSITKDDLLGPIMRKKIEHANALNIRHNTSLDYQKLDSTNSKDRVVNRGNSPVLLARETRGAVAAKNAESTLQRRSDFTLRAQLDLEKKEGLKPKPEFELLPRSDLTPKQLNNFLSSNNEGLVYEDLNRTEVNSLAATKQAEKISQKIQYFEDRQYDEPPKTIYHAREDSSPDENELMRVIEENRLKRGYHKHKELSTSLTNLKDIFGETNSSRVNFHLHSLPQRPPDEVYVKPNVMEVSKETNYEIEDASLNDSINAFDTYYHRSRSFSPPQSQASSSYLHRVRTGDVQKIKEKFESISDDNHDRQHFFGLNPLRKVRSDPELIPISSESKDTFKTLVNFDEHGDVSWITHKFEVRNSNEDRGRRRNRINISPTNSLKNRLMPHIDIISKTAALKRELHTKSPTKHYSPTRSDSSNSGAVDRIRSRYESISSPAAASRYLSSSNPDLRDVNIISRHLTANWIAHKYPSPRQNSCSERVFLKQVRRRSSTSPPRPPKSFRHPKHNATTVIMSPNDASDIFANQKFDPKIHQPKARYVPGDTEVNDWKKVFVPATCTGNCDVFKKSMAVTFEDYDFAPPVPPQPYTKNVSLDQNGNCSESPTTRYHESDVNIHFKTPIRHEYKNRISEEDLALRQADQMQKLYQEERRRKYLQELQDMNSRRHTDNFTPSQKSPIALNRYDDFPVDLVPKLSNTATYPKAAARALYNFQGQSARELSFKKGDLIYIRRVIDKNWYEGEHNAMIGLLPVNYVEILNKDKVRQPPQHQPKKPSEGQARAKYHFQAQSGVELSLNKGELVTLTRKVDDNWFEGKIANRKGIFPVSYVEVLTDIGAEEIAAKTTVITTQSTTNLRPTLDTLRTNINNEFNIITQNGHQPPNGILKEARTAHKTNELHVDTSTEPLAYRALYKYRPQNSDELELMEGDIVHVLEKCDDGWFVGTSQSSGCFGTFPGNYVERV